MANNDNEMKREIINRSISFDLETLKYLDQISQKEHRKRSAMIRVLIQQHMEANFKKTATH